MTNKTPKTQSTRRLARRLFVFVVFVSFVTFLVLLDSSHNRIAAQGSGAAASDSRGKTVYEEHCVECHGSSGQGDGPASFLLNPHPRDFTAARYKIRTTETGS